MSNTATGLADKPQELLFKISVALKDLIGRELVTNKQVAILELVKNSYDALSPIVRVVFADGGAGKGSPERILVIDKGKGMSKDDIINKWMFVGYSEKRGGSEGQSLSKDINPKRSMAGRKGIGRFSCDKLGRYLDMYTKTRGHKWNHLRVDWGAFEELDQTAEFSTVRPSLDYQDPPSWIEVSDYESGTVLDISGLREQWSFDDVLKLRRWLERLMDPFNAEDYGFSITIDAPMFKEDEKRPSRKNRGETVNGPVKNTLRGKLEETTTMISCLLKAKKATSRLLDKGRLVYEVVDDVSGSKYLGRVDVHFDIYYLSRAAKAAFTKDMGIQPVKYGSVMLYRNNFRIMPFGEPGDDWLGLERRKSQGTRRFLASRELVGHVSIVDPDGIFEEVSSRSAGIKNEDALKELQRFVVDKLVRRLERYVVEVIKWDNPEKLVSARERGRKLLEVVTSLAGGREGVINIIPGEGALDAIREAGLADTDTIIQNLKGLSGKVSEEESARWLEENISALRSSLAHMREELARRQERIFFLEKAQSRNGELITMMQHAFAIINASAEPAISQAYLEAVSLGLPEKSVKLLASVHVAIQKLKKLAQLASTAKFDLGKEEVMTDVVDYTLQYLDSVWGETFALRGLTLRTLGGDTKYERKLDLLAYSLVIDNLVDNAFKAGARNLFVQFNATSERLSVLFSDDGDGVSTEASAKLFSPGFSTRGGTGLGLYSTMRILEGLGGSIKFAGNDVEGLGKGACFKVTL